LAACGVMADSNVGSTLDLLKQLLLNLVDNTLTYTPPGGHVDLALSVADGHARLVVPDTRPGIAPADLARIFERFYRLDRARAAQRWGRLGAGHCPLDRGGPWRPHRGAEHRGPGQHVDRGATTVRPFSQRRVPRASQMAVGQTKVAWRRRVYRRGGSDTF
jgi:Histidine kinase-, DNA gyrase B-, and HSP90-like ATPase